MNQDSIRIGRISKAIERAAKADFKDNIWVYVLEADLRRFSELWPTSYLQKLEEAKIILHNPLYLSYRKDAKRLFIIREYCHQGEFQKVALEIVSDGQWHLKHIFSVTAARAKAIDDYAPIQQIIR